MPEHLLFISRKLKTTFLLIVAVAGFTTFLSGQTQEPRVVQFSGKVVSGADENESPVVLPYAVVAVKGTSRGTLTDITGFFSIVVRTDETLVFSSLGYKDVYVPVPDTLTGDYHSMVVVMRRDTFLLPTVVIYPWPDPDNFTKEFLAMDVHNDLEDIAEENLSPEKMEMLREIVPTDGPEHTQLYLKQQSQKYYYEGQLKPQRIFDAFAWKEFIQAWKRGDFKKKK
jgi:hypothetical protein